ncbi:MAG: ribonuclease P [Candidatus Bathyarchaeota archaeon]|jgi:ribonuclease P protein subunit RPR2
MPRKPNQTAKERINILFRQAQKIHTQNPQLAQRYTDLARQIAMRTRTRLPPEHRHKICTRCKAYLIPGTTSRTRIRQRREPHITTTCLRCGHIHRRPLKERVR